MWVVSVPRLSTVPCLTALCVKSSKGYTPQNTKRSTKWALAAFQAWAQERSIDPDDTLLSSDPKILNSNLSRFVVEIRKENGTPYPPSTLHQMLCGLLRYMRERNPDTLNFLNQKDTHFKPLQSTLYSYFHRLHSDGMGRQVHHAEIISVEEEDKLWEPGVLSTTTPKGLLNAGFYVIGKFFCLRGGQEHRHLKLSQLKRHDDHYVYHENISKSCSGSFKKLHVKSKVVPVYAVPEAGQRCPLFILDEYISRIPKGAVDKDLFYVRPLEKFSVTPQQPWYSAVPLGKNTLQTMVKSMCSSAGLKGNKTNHSLRATGATELFKRSAPEKIIQERTGHRSLEALRTYERSSQEQHKSASSILSRSITQTTFQQQMTSYNEQIVNIKTTPCSDSSGINMAFHNLHNCTINISNPPTSTPQ